MVLARMITGNWDGTTTNRNRPTQILDSGISKISAGGDHSMIIKADGSLHTFGNNPYGQWEMAQWETK